jgi:hypothetical protein
MLSARGYPSTAKALATHIQEPRFVELLQQFVYEQVNGASSADVPLNDCPSFVGAISIFHSVIACFYAPSNLCGASGMYHECIHSNPNWHGEYARYDMMFVVLDAELDSMPGMAIGHACLLFSFKFRNKVHSCTLVHWLVPLDDPDEDTGMWVVQPEFHSNGSHTLSIICYGPLSTNL